MASNKDYLDFILELLGEINGISYKKMMGEFILYKDGIIFGGIYDNRFLVKNTPFSKSLGMKEQIPYPGAKPMFCVDSEDPDEVSEIVNGIIKDLK